MRWGEVNLPRSPSAPAVGTERNEVTMLARLPMAQLERHPEVQTWWHILLGQFGRRILAETTGR